MINNCTIDFVGWMAIFNPILFAGRDWKHWNPSHNVTFLCFQSAINNTFCNIVIARERSERGDLPLLHFTKHKNQIATPLTRLLVKAPYRIGARSNYVECQEYTGLKCSPFFNIALRMVSILCIQATNATFFSFPAASSRS